MTPVRLRALIDTNVLISYLLAPVGSNSPPSSILAHAFSADFELFISETTLAELRDRTQDKPYLASRITAGDVDQMESTIRSIATIIPSPNVLPPAATRDPKDDYLLAPDIVALVDHIVTGDKDLLEAEGVSNTLVVTPAAFLRLLDERLDSGHET